MKRYFLLFVMLIIAPFFSSANTVKNVAITAIVEHPSLDQIRDGVKDELVESGFKLDQDLKVQYKSAQGSSATAAQIARQFVAAKPDVIVAIATPSAQATAAATKQIPVVFAGITDPIAAKLIKDWQPSGTNITGVSDYQEIVPQVDFMKKIVPNVKSVGYIYSPNEINSTVVLKNLQAELTKHNIALVAVPAQRTADISTAANTLKGKVDLIYTTTDNNVVSAYDSLVKFANENKIPLLASFPDAIERGAVAAYGMSYYDVGRQSGKLVVRILKGEKAGDIKPEIGEALRLVINTQAAKKQGITLSPQIIESAYKVIGDN
ncbi:MULTISPECIES: ABC transporter substrate-binding protein [unclassified Gilliamella]|uniref:ABC transporter substrate-binding protein n=1 Tax=unclassified Gilliamella TaxID=2685620 RepID=UPI001C6A1345|nr:MULTISPECIES: ABC transporter substrate-binding protein [unclassified Gilliamella]MCX8601775.1 ABC transporter substrate-binding protein [Gilliamella sp. B3722]MCX8608150.1 ABC transporter substrate-binding protein [Gilliamella sp. B3771]MCX8611153.1 ABC transporter substrate-binding protein [Gilliamella sp. B3891]MCX8613506.1 ABC transporter substrate-binding protein [Gilliamella sp. B3773]MCX8614387.1 ABC transporter substrate-binding protein [Gilliamella sp. B3770]